MSLIQKELKRESSLYISFENILKYIQKADGGEADLADVARFLLMDYEKKFDAGKVLLIDDYEFEGEMIDDNAYMLNSTQTEYAQSEVANPFRLYLEDMAKYNLESAEYFGLNYYLEKHLVIQYAADILGKDYSRLPDIDEVLEEIQRENKENRKVNDNIMIELFGIDNDESKQESYSSFHEQPLSLKLANNAFSRFWGNANPAEKDTQPNNSDIAKWVIEQSGGKITQTMADKIAQIIRPEWAATGRKPEK
ncbi:hypothetical protein [Neisseria sp.]